MSAIRYPITTPIEEKKTVTLYQVPLGDREGFISNMRGNYLSLANMEPVYTTLMDGDDEDILDDCFRNFNDDEHISQHFLYYSMSVGDIVQIGDTAYRCLPTGWEKI